MRRRQFIAVVSATGAALSLFEASSLTAVAATNTPVTLQPTGLPPTIRPRDVYCAECGEFMATALIDELDRASKFVCGDCFREAETERDDNAAADPYCENCDEKDDEIEELQTKLDSHERLAAWADTHTYTLRDMLLDVRGGSFTTNDMLKRLERMSESLDEILRSVPN